MARLLAKSFVLLALGFLLLSCSTSSAEDDDLRTLNQQVIQLIEQGKYQEAIPIAERAVEVAKRTRGPEDLVTADTLNSLGFLFVKIQDYPKAEPLYQETLRIRQKVLGPEHPDTATSLNNLAALYEYMYEYAKAEPLYLEALRVYRKILGPEHPYTVVSLSNLGEVYRHMHEYAKAEPLLQEALRIRQKVLGPEHPDTAKSLNSLASLYRVMSEYAKAEPLYLEALRIRQKALGPEDPETASSLNGLAELYQDLGEYTKAEPLFQEAIRITQKALGPEHPDTTAFVSNLAALYWAMGEYAKAEPLLQEALRICQKVLGSEHLETAASRNNLAALYQDMHEYAKAEPLYLEALHIYQRVLGPEHPETATGLNNLAALYWAMGEYAKVEPRLQEALRIRQKVLGPEHPDAANSLDSLATLYQEMHEYAKAEQVCQEALRIRQKVLGPEHPDTAVSLNNLGDLYRSMGEYAKAEPRLQDALRIRQKVLGPEHPYTANNLDDLALLEFDLGRMEEARALARQASAAQLTILSKIFSFTSEEQRLAYLHVFHPYSLFPFLKGTESDLAAAILRYKGVVQDSIVEDRLLAEASDGSEDQKLVEQLNLDKRQLGQLLLLPAQKLSDETNQRIEALEGDVEKIESHFAQHIAGLGQARRALGVSLEQVQATIPHDGALIEYLLYPHYLGKGKWERRYGAIVLSANTPPRWVSLGGAKEIEAALNRYDDLVRSARDDDEMAAILQKLYQEVWEPIVQVFPTNVNRVIISPDGQLNFLSFATLLDGDKRFIAEKYSIQYVASGRDLLHELKPPSDRSAAVVFAAPDFNLSSNQTVADATSKTSIGVLRGIEKTYMKDLRFPPLDGTATERAKMTRIFVEWRSETISLGGKDATKEALFRIHSPYILHLATHGFFTSEEKPDTKATELQPVNLQTSVFKSKFFNNPMHRSGLALAGAQTTLLAWKHEEVPPVQNDGIVTAEDASTLDLQLTWLVTLSACDTGSGEARAGEGVMGLRRGFIQAGAQNLLITLWPIRDEATVEIMADFYAAARNTGNAPQALAEVQRNWLLKLRTEKGLAEAVNLAGPFIMSSQGIP